jgi:excisionase family DNA binding protein
MSSTGLSDVERSSMSGQTASGEPRAYTLNEAAAMLGMSKSSLERVIGRGELRALKFGCLTRVMSVELERYVAEAPRATFRVKAAS